MKRKESGLDDRGFICSRRRRERGGEKGSICHMLPECVNEPTSLREPERWTPLRRIEFADRDCRRQRGHMRSGERVRILHWRAEQVCAGFAEGFTPLLAGQWMCDEPSVPSLLHWLITRAIWPNPGRGAITEPAHTQRAGLPTPASETVVESRTWHTATWQNKKDCFVALHGKKICFSLGNFVLILSTKIYFKKSQILI